MNRFQRLCLLLLTAPILLVAQDDGEHEEVASRLEPQEENPTLIVEGEEQSPTEMEMGFEYGRGRLPLIYYSPSHHRLAALAITGSNTYQIDLEDGSGWQIHDNDREVVSNWRVNDPLIITQNHRWFSSYKYRILNKSDGTEVETNLKVGPLKGGVHTRYIRSIDYSHREISLTDGTHWEISTYDMYRFNNWQVGDGVILGTNSGWDSKKEALLINFSLNNAVRATQF